MSTGEYLRKMAAAIVIWGLLMFAADRLWENHQDNEKLEAEIERSARLNDQLQDGRDARRDEVLGQLR